MDKKTFLSGRQDEKEIPQLKKLKPRVPLETFVKQSKLFMVDSGLMTSMFSISVRYQVIEIACIVAGSVSQPLVSRSWKRRGEIENEHGFGLIRELRQVQWDLILK